MSWNFNIEEAPKGRRFKREIKQKDKIIYQPVFEEQRVLTASKCGNVFVSYMTEKGRWSGYTDKELPIAWMPFPKHPNGEKE